jgi:hypothetical protein
MDDVPIELKKEIISYLPDYAKRQIRLANSKWFNLVNYNNFTIYLTKKSEWKQIVDRFEKYNKPISLRLEKNIMRNVHDIFEQLTRLTNLVSCSAQSTTQTPDLTEYHNMTAMTNLKSVPFDLYFVPTYVLEKLTQLEVLEEDLRVVDSLPFLPQLRELSLTTETTPTNIPNLEKNLRRLHQLKKFKFWTGQETGGATLSLKYMTALEELRLSWMPFTDLEYCSRLTSLAICLTSFTEREKQSLQTLNQIQHLDISVDEDTFYLTALTNLRSLKILSRYRGKKHSILGNIVARNLTLLDISSLETFRIDVENFSQLISLKELHVIDVECGHPNFLTLTNLTKFRWYGEIDYVDDCLETYLPQMTNLRQLGYKPNVFHESSIDLAALTNLESLELLMNATFTGFDNLTNLTSLSVMSFQDNWLSLPYLEKLTKLVELDCDLNADVVQFLSATTNLRKLGLKKLRTEEDLLFVTKFTQLTGLILQEKACADGIEVKGHCLTNLTALQQLSLFCAEEAIADRFPNLRLTFNCKF